MVFSYIKTPKLGDTLRLRGEPRVPGSVRKKNRGSAGRGRSKSLTGLRRSRRVVEQDRFVGKDKLGYLGCIITVFVLVALNPDQRTQLLLTLLGAGMILAAYVLRSRFGGHAPSRAREVVE